MKEIFKKFWVKNQKKIILISTVILLLIGIANFFFIFEVTAQSNDECLWIEKKSSDGDSIKVYFDQVKENGVTWQAGIRNGDQLLAIDGVKLINNLVASRTLDRIQAGDYATYKILKNGKILEVKILVKKLINFSGLAFALLSFIWMIVGFIVVMAKSEGRTQNAFYRVGIAATLFAMADMLYRGQQVPNPIFQNVILLFTVDALWTLGGVFFPFLLVRFFSLFPKELSLVKKKWFNRLLNFGPYIIFAVIISLKIYFVYQKGNGKLYETISTIISFLIGCGLVIGLVFLFINYVKLKTKQERNAIFVILVSYLISVIALIYTFTLAARIGGVIFNNPYYFTPVILIALLPIAFGYSIFRYSLMDVSEVVKNTIVYGAATVALAGIYFLIIYLIGQSISAAIGTEYQGVIAGMVFVLFAVVFQSTKDKFQDYLTEKFYPEQFAFQSRLLVFSNEVASIVGQENILDSTLDMFVKSLRIKTFGLLLRDDEDVYKLARHQGISNSWFRLDDKKNIIEKFLLERSLIGLEPIIERQDFRTIWEDDADRLIVEDIFTIIPLFIKHKVIGLLLFGLKQSGSRFSGKDIELLISAANQVAVSIENARLYESETEKQKMERDLENARKIQETLLPKVFPKIEGLDFSGKMIPAMHVGGDYFDLIKISEKKLFVVVGDVSGKGLSASFYMSKLQTMIRLYCTDGKSPRDVLIDVNKNIYENIERGWFITVSLALFDLDTKRVTFCRAGHPGMIRIRNGECDTFASGGMGVGLDKGELFNSSLEEESLQLQREDLFFIYSDGVTELMNSANQFYGEARLEKLLVENFNHNCSQIEKILLNDLNEFRGKVPQYDDITVLSIKTTF
ncbi:MAG: SpoIIE family protein phosphatase [Ignavibacteriales bacterium]|nr:SpoIIE family protein phosphatase [Ignavibacteriales bacterium]